MERVPLGFARAVFWTDLEAIAHPMADTARRIWSRAACHTPRDITVRLLDALQLSELPLTILDLEPIAAGKADRWLDLIFGFACRGWANINIRHPVTNQTLVSLGPLSRPKKAAP